MLAIRLLSAWLAPVQVRSASATVTARPHLTSLLRSLCCPCALAARLIEASVPAGVQAQHSLAVPAVMASGGARVPGPSRLNPAHAQGRLQPSGACQDSFLGSVEMPERAAASNQLLLAGSQVLGSSSYVAGNRVAMQQLSLQVSGLTSLLALPFSDSCGVLAVTVRSWSRCCGYLSVIRAADGCRAAQCRAASCTAVPGSRTGRLASKSRCCAEHQVMAYCISFGEGGCQSPNGVQCLAKGKLTGISCFKRWLLAQCWTVLWEAAVAVFLALQRQDLDLLSFELCWRQPRAVSLPEEVAAAGAALLHWLWVSLALQSCKAELELGAAARQRAARPECCLVPLQSFYEGQKWEQLQGGVVRRLQMESQQSDTQLQKSTGDTHPQPPEGPVGHTDAQSPPGSDPLLATGSEQLLQAHESLHIPAPPVVDGGCPAGSPQASSLSNSSAPGGSLYASTGDASSPLDSHLWHLQGQAVQAPGAHSAELSSAAQDRHPLHRQLRQRTSPSFAPAAAAPFPAHLEQNAANHVSSELTPLAPSSDEPGDHLV